MNLLKQSTATTIKLGPFVDSTDGVTPETGLTISQSDIRLSKNGGAFAQTNNVAGATHDENGWYGIPLDTTDTGTVGRLQVAIYESGALPCFNEFIIVPANIYDSLVSNTDVLMVDVTQIGGDTQSATDLKNFADAGYDPATNKVQGVVLTDTCTTLTGNTAQTGDSFARLGTPAGASIAADLVVIDNYVDDLESRLTAIRAGYLDNLSLGAVALASVCTEARLANLDALISSRATPAQVNTEVVDVISVDTIAEMTQEVPPSSPTMQQIINYLYRMWRNKIETTATAIKLYDDAGATVLTKSTISDDGTTFTKNEYVTGP